MRDYGGISICHYLSALVCVAGLMLAPQQMLRTARSQPPEPSAETAASPPAVMGEKIPAGPPVADVPLPAEVSDPAPPAAIVIEAPPPGSSPAVTVDPPAESKPPADAPPLPVEEERKASSPLFEAPENASPQREIVEVEESLPEFENGGSVVDELLPEQTPPPDEYGVTQPFTSQPSGTLHSQPMRIGPSPLAHMNMLRTRLHEMIRLPRFSHRDPDDPNRFTGAGEPLHGTSWRNRPLHVDLFFGGMFADDLVAGEISQSAGEFAGIRLGADFDHYWGVDFRYGAADLTLNSHRNGAPLGSSHNQFFDLQLVHYPWGDSRWRPFFAIGLGLMKVDGGSLNDTLVQIPIGVGLKYFWYPWLALRFDAYNNITIPGHSAETVNHGSFTIGVEWRFGGRRKSYFPHHPGKYIW